ncbi:MAG: AAA family ATPase [Ignisphaera sp.]|nr:AAA family ATPase [Ignisphaera sp.]
MNILLLKYMLKKAHYDKFRHFIKPTEKEINNLYDVLDNLMAKYQRDLTIDEYGLSVLSTFPGYTDYLSRVRDSDISEDILLESVRTLQNQQMAYDLALVAIDVSEGRESISKVFDKFKDFETTDTVEETVFVTDDLEVLYTDTRHKSGLRWRLDSLNKSLGSLRKGDFGFIFARPETGKTTILASELTHMASQLSDDDGPILWFNNEEGGAKVKVRLYQAALGVSLVELYMDRKKSYNSYMRLTKGKIKLYDSASVTKWQVERIVKELKPSLIVFDQIDKIKGFNADRNDLRLGSIYIWARELAKSYCPVIGICQSDVSGEGKKWLTMDNVAESKTSKQAEADWILGLGKTHELGMEFNRYLHLSKNKLSGDDDTDPSLRHGKLEVLIQPDIARYCDYGQ